MVGSHVYIVMRHYCSLRGCQIKFQLATKLLIAEHGYDPGYSTDHGYVSDPLPYGESYGGRRNPNVFPDHDGMFPPTDHVAGVGAGGGNEAQALIALDKANNKPVAFSVRTNVMYDGTLDDDSPVHGCAVR